MNDLATAADVISGPPMPDRDHPVVSGRAGSPSRPHHAGQRYFSRLTMIFTGRRPAHVPVTQTMTLPPS